MIAKIKMPLCADPAGVRVLAREIRVIAENWACHPLSGQMVVETEAAITRFLQPLYEAAEELNAVLAPLRDQLLLVKPAIEAAKALEALDAVEDVLEDPEP